MTYSAPYPRTTPAAELVLNQSGKLQANNFNVIETFDKIISAQKSYHYGHLWNEFYAETKLSNMQLDIKA